MPESRLIEPGSDAARRPIDHDEDPQHRVLIGVVALLAITIAAYVPVIATAGFIWDDDDYLTTNEFVQSPDGIDEIWELDPFERSNTRQYYPMVFTTFWIEHALWGLNPTGYHLVNVLLHALNALLLWRLLVIIRVPGAWIAAAIFALHPVHVESVAWITERKNVLSLFFYLTAAWAYLHFDVLREKTDAEERRNIWGWYGATLVLFIAALLSKSVTCSLPAALILVHLWQRKRLSIARLAWLVPFFVVGFIFALNTAMLERVQVGATGEAFDWSFIERSLIASKALLFYPWKFLAPIPLIFIYPRWEIDASNLASYWSVLAVLLVAAGCIVLYLRGRRGVPLAVAFYAGTIFPALGFFNVYPHLYSFVADHFVYHASIGLIALAAAGIATVLRDPRVRTAVMVVPLALLFLLTWRQGLMYENTETLWRATINRNPDAWMAHNNLAGDLLDAVKLQVESGQPADPALIEEARYHAEVAVEIKPDHFRARSNLAEALRLLGRPEDGVPQLEQAVSIRPDLPELHWKLGRLYQLTDRYDEAIDAYREAIRLLDEMHADRTASPWRRADYVFYQLELGRLLYALNRWEEARPILEQVARVQPRNFSALLPLAHMAEEQGDSAAASRYFQQIVEQRAARSVQEGITALMRYIRFLTTASDPDYRDLDEAERLARGLVQQTGGQNPAMLLVLASVQHESGRTEDALQTAEQALRLAESMGVQEIIDQAREEIERIRSDQPLPDDGPRS